jgi:selenocysteine-specific elongation factor
MPPLKDRQRIRFLVATQEVLGRVQLVGQSESGITYANLLLESEVVSAWADHFIIRRYSPLETLGGGRVLEPDALPLRARLLTQELDAARALDVTTLNVAALAFLRHRGSGGIASARLAAILGVPISRLRDILSSISHPERVREFGDYLLLEENYQQIIVAIVQRLTDLHAKLPDSAGFASGELRQGTLAVLTESLFSQIIEQAIVENIVAREGGQLRLPTKRIELTPAQSQLIAKLQGILSAEGFAPSSSINLAEKLGRNKIEIEKALVLMERMGSARRLGVDLFFASHEFDAAIHKIESLLETGKELSVAEVSQHLSSSRKYVVPFLEYLDSKGITQRAGNIRIKGRNFPVSIHE